MTTNRNAGGRPYLLWLWAIGLTLVSVGVGQAQQGPPIPPPQIFYSKVEPLTDTIAREQRDPRPASAGDALQVYDWLLWGTLSVGGAYDNNVNSTPSNPITVYGARLQPAVVAERNTGIQRTLLYGVGDFRYYPAIGRTEIIDTTGGVVHVWEIQRDFIFRTQGQVTRGQDALGVTNVGSGLILVDPVKSLRFYGSTSLEKGFGLFFTAIGASVTREMFDDTRSLSGATISEGFRDGTTLTVNGRLGYHVTPLVYSFVEPSANVIRHTAANLDSEGQRIIAGFGTARIGLMNGEVYGGYMDQHFADPMINPLRSGIFGGRVSWYPTRFLTFTTSFDQGLATSDFTTRAFTPGSITKTNTARFQATWDMTTFFTWGGTVEYRQYAYLASFRIDHLWVGSANLTYWVRPRFGITLDYSHFLLETNLVGGNYSRDFVSLGAKTRF